MPKFLRKKIPREQRAKIRISKKNEQVRRHGFNHTEGSLLREVKDLELSVEEYYLVCSNVGEFKVYTQRSLFLAYAWIMKHVAWRRVTLPHGKKKYLGFNAMTEFQNWRTGKRFLREVERTLRHSCMNWVKVFKSEQEDTHVLYYPPFSEFKKAWMQYFSSFVLKELTGKDHTITRRYSRQQQQSDRKEEEELVCELCMHDESKQWSCKQCAGIHNNNLFNDDTEDTLEGIIITPVIT